MKKRTFKFLPVMIFFALGVVVAPPAQAEDLSGKRGGELRDFAKSRFGKLPGGDSFVSGSLDEVPVPEPRVIGLNDMEVDEPVIGAIIRDKEAAIALGKALFWDMQVGSDNQACASCHFHAGADSRAKNQLSPGLLRVGDPSRDPDADPTFGNEYGYTASGQVAGPNYTLEAADFPFHQLSDHTERNSDVLFDMNDAASSQGTFGGGFVSVNQARNTTSDNCGNAINAIFNVAGVAVRKVEPRNTPTMINAVFNHRNFWDGRANNLFNGLNPLGKRGNLPTPADPEPGILVLQDDGTVATVSIEIANSSLASQAVGPPLSDFEMSCAGRNFADLGKKLLTRKALAQQDVAPDDSVLGVYRDKKGRGLKIQYLKLVHQAFHEKYWAKDGNQQLFTADGKPLPPDADPGLGYTQMEVNWALFFGLAIQEYERTLVSGNTPFDAYMKGEFPALTEQEQQGLDVFLTKGKCNFCHVGPEFTGAAVRFRANQLDGDEEPIERMLMGDGGTAVYDGGFYNIGVRPTHEDLGIGADLAGFPLSFARQEVNGPEIDDFNFHTDKFEVPGPIVAGERVAIDGAFKVASVRNVELTGPFFHNGGQATLSQVVEFYDRGGDRRDTDCGDTSGFDAECSNLDPDIERLNFTPEEEAALVAFMLALTDNRVKYEKAPFDHPQLYIPGGHPGNQFEVTDDGTGRATDEWLEIPAVGADGGAPLGTFLDLPQ